MRFSIFLTAIAAAAAPILFTAKGKAMDGTMIKLIARMEASEHRVFLPIILETPSVVVLHDSFAGTGALANHLPEIRPAGSSWTILSGSFADLDGSGILSYSGGASGETISGASGEAIGGASGETGLGEASAGAAGRRRSTRASTTST